MVRARIALPCFVSLVLVACGGGGAAPSGPTAGPTAAASGGAGGPTAGSAPGSGTASRPVPQSDLAIADLVYTDAARVPSGFHTEPARYDAAYATLAHVRNTDLDPAATPPHELCATAFAAAFDAAESAARAWPVYGDLVENTTTARYHEFVRRLRTTPERHAIQRVYRCDYLERAGVDLRAANGPAGRFRVVAFGAEELRALGEYLWTFSPDNNAGRAVLAGETQETTTAVTHRLHVARLVRAAPPASCDRVEVWRVELQAARADGALVRSESLAFAIGARRTDGVTSLCG